MDKIKESRGGSSFSTLLNASIKSKDTEEWLDIHFTRPIGLAFALIWNKFGVHPNVVTILSCFLGAAAGVMFYFTDLTHNILGILFLVFADFCDSTDGQLARLTGKKTLVGRVLDGVSGDIWFFCIYFFLCLRMTPETIPGTNYHWGILIWLLAALAGIFSHSPQCSLSDYYRQIHLYFLKGRDGSELDTSARQDEIYRSTPKTDRLARLFYHGYANYCRSQEKRTPQFQKFFAWWQSSASKLSPEEREAVRQRFLSGSRPLLKYTNLLTYNSRAITLYVTCLLGSLTGDAAGPWIYFLFEIIVLNMLYVHMRRSHERLCGDIISQTKD